jgi:hypothetical protein
MKRSGATLQDYRTNTNRNREKWYGHISRMNANMIQETNRKFHKKETDIMMWTAS